MKSIFILAWDKLFSEHLYNSCFIVFMFIPFSVTGCSLELLKTEEKGIVTFCKITNEKIRKQLIETGINIGAKITLIQKKSFFQIKVNDIPRIINIETARAIYVRIINN